jgi:drug/metabolite transporter (DMT)-like permease
VACAVIATIGVARVAFGAAKSGEGSGLGDVMAVAALFAWAWYFIASKQARRHLDTLEYLTVVMIGGVPIVGVLALVTGAFSEPGNQLDLTNLWWVLLVVFLPGSGHLLINWAHNSTTITLSSLLTLLMPVVSTALAALWLDEQVTAIQVVGIAVVLAALAIVIVGDSRAASIESASAEEGPHV